MTNCVLVLLAGAALAFLLTLQKRPRNTLAPLDPESPEMQIAELLSGVNGAYIFRYRAESGFSSMTLYCTAYRFGEQTSRQPIPMSAAVGTVQQEGLIAILPDHDRRTLRLILAAEGIRYAVEFPVPEDAENWSSYGRGTTQLSGETAIRFGEEQGLAALVFSPNEMRLLDIAELERGNISPINEYLYYFSLRFER